MDQRRTIKKGPSLLPCSCDPSCLPAHQCGLRRDAIATAIPIRRASSSGTFPILHHDEELPSAKRLRQTTAIVASSSQRSKSKSTTKLQQRRHLKGFPADLFHPEPFNAYPIAAVGCVHRMFEYLVHVWIPQRGRALPVSGHDNPYQSLCLPYALQNAALFEAFITVGRVSWLMARDLPLFEDRALAYHRNNAMAVLQERLESKDKCADDTSILTLAALTTVNYTLGQHDGAEAHLYLMRRLVGIRGGMKAATAWDQFMGAIVTAFEGMWSFVLANQAIASQPHRLSFAATESSLLKKDQLIIYENHPFSPELCAALAKIPKSLSEMTMAGYLSVQVVRLIGEIPTTLSPRHHEIDTAGSSTQQGQGGRGLSLTIPDLLHLSIMQTTKIEKLLCQGLLGYCFALFYRQAVPNILSDKLNSMRDAFEQHLPENELIHPTCLVWIAVAISGAMRMSQEQKFAEYRPLEYILDKHKKARVWTYVEAILRNFLWHDDLIPKWHAAWLEAMNRKGFAGLVA